MPTTVEPPMKHAPMEMEPAVAPSNAEIAAGARPSIVTQQPRSEPRPEAEPQMSLRGGALHCGFDCCGGSCRFNRSCC